MAKHLSERALNFIKRQGRNKDYEISTDVLEKHLTFYHLQDSSEIIRFQENFAGLNIQDIVIYIFTSKQVKEHKGITIYHWNEQVLFPINDNFYIAENGEIAFRDCGCNSWDFYFYYESFETFVEQQAFFEEHQYYKYLSGLEGFDVICNIHLVKEYFSDYDFVSECSDKYHLVWKNGLNLVHARNYSGDWVISFDGISEDSRYNLIKNLKTKKLIE